MPELNAANTDSHRFVEQGSDVAAPSATFAQFYFKATGAFYRTASAVFSLIMGTTGALDNKLLRSDGTGTKTLQASSVELSDAGDFTGVESIRANDSSGLVLMEDGGTTVVTIGAGSRNAANFPNVTNGSPSTGDVWGDGYSVRLRTGDTTVYLDNGYIKYLTSTNTTDATPTITDTYAIAEGEALQFFCEVTGYKTDKTSMCAGYVRGNFRRQSGGNVTLVGALDKYMTEDNGASPDFTLAATIGTQSVDLIVTGVAAENWTWTSHMRLI